MIADLARRLVPHAETQVAAQLWAAGRLRKLANYLWVEFLIGRGSERMWGGSPYWLTIDPTNFCQLQCPFCPTGAGRGVRDKGSMRLEHFAAYMDRVGPAAIHLDMMNWGESLLNRDLPEMIACAKRHGIEVKLDANFNDVTPETIEALVGSGLDVLSLSIDGLSQETYARYRVGGNLEKVLANLRALVAARDRRKLGTPRIIWQFLVFRHNEHEAPRVEAAAKALGVDQVSLVSPFLPNEPGYLAEWSARDPLHRLYPEPSRTPSEDESRRAAESAHVKRIPSSSAFHARRFRPGLLLTFRDFARAARFGGLRGAWSRLAAAAAQTRARRGGSRISPFARADAARVCKWPWAGIAVNPDGGASPCCSVEDQADDFGNAFSERWGALWNGSAYRRARRHVRRYSLGARGVLADSDHVCERCTAIGHANFKFPIPPAKEERACA
ncbi:MAG: radical SAM protein [Elusimicrobia bacterium]|nr:radical SAM protein [Elusimicrobiota bacterium]